MKTKTVQTEWNGDNSNSADYYCRFAFYLFIDVVMIYNNNNNILITGLYKVIVESCSSSLESILSSQSSHIHHLVLKFA